MEKLLENKSNNATDLEFIKPVYEVTTQDVDTQCG